MEDDDEIPKAGPVFVQPTKKYGLQIRGNLLSKQTVKPTNALNSKQIVKPCIFDEDDDEEDQNNDKNASSKKPPISLTTSNRLKKQTQIELEKAISEDANVFEYDSIYDELEKAKQKIDPKLKPQSKEPKYIAGIMKAAAKRQMEFEKVQERKIQKEREEEGDLWSDKETFVTTAYRKKMEERQQLEEEERRQEQIEALLDVRKQKDLSGFYSTVLKMRSGEFVMHEEGEKDKLALAELEKKELEIKKTTQHKVYRTKKEESSDEEEEVTKEPEIFPEDQDEAISDEDADKEVKIKIEKEETVVQTTETNLDIKIEIESLKQEKILEEAKKVEKEDKEQRRINMLKKRTVGSVLDQELSDYFNRKSTILAAKSYVERE